MLGFNETTALFIVFINLVLTCFVMEIFRRQGVEKFQRYCLAGAGAVWTIVLYFAVITESILPNSISGLGFFALLSGIIATFTALFLLSPKLKNALLQTSHEILLLPQGLRMFLGAGFLVSAALGKLPQTFGIIDGLTHMTAAFLALEAGLLWAHGEKRIFSIYLANIFGLLDIIAVGLGLSFILLPQITIYNSIMVAALYAAPIFVALHIASLYKLTVERQH